MKSHKGIGRWFCALGLLASLSQAAVVDNTDQRHPIDLTPATSAPLPIPPKPPGPQTPYKGNLVERKLVIGSEKGPVTETVADVLEIFRNGKAVRTIRTPMFIREWHFLADGGQVEVCSGPLSGPGIYQLIDIATARTLETVRDPLKAKSPRWAQDAQKSFLRHRPQP